MKSVSYFWCIVAAIFMKSSLAFGLADPTCAEGFSILVQAGDDTCKKTTVTSATTQLTCEHLPTSINGMSHIKWRLAVDMGVGVVVDSCIAATQKEAMARDAKCKELPNTTKVTWNPKAGADDCTLEITKVETAVPACPADHRLKRDRNNSTKDLCMTATDLDGPAPAAPAAESAAPPSSDGKKSKSSSDGRLVK